LSTQPEQAAKADTGSRENARFDVRRRRLRFLGLTMDDMIRYFFEGNAILSIVVLALITLFLFKEGFGFFGQNFQNLQVYRKAGLEYVDIFKGQEADHTALTRYANEIRLRWFTQLTVQQKLSPERANEQLAAWDDFSNRFADSVAPLRTVLAGGPESDSGLVDRAMEIKTKYLVLEDQREARRQLLDVGKETEAAAIHIADVHPAEDLEPLLAVRPLYAQANKDFTEQLRVALATMPAAPGQELQAMEARLRELTSQYVAGFPELEKRVASWNYLDPIPWYRCFTSFLFGREWLTASFWQDWYGILPLFVGSLTVSFVALLIAVPLGVGAAIYVNQLASLREQKFIKPGIEFISAFPSVVLGFFGIAVLGQALRTFSHAEWLSWVPGFPFAERLNILTAGCLLAVIAVPTIFTLAEDALNNVPRAFKEASYALGATRVQTILRIIAPAALSGIISAVLLGFGRVIGETMVVLLCAGNRIAIPDFTAGLGVVTQPVHTMTGIVAQEMGEVVRGSIHYRALFVVGLVLFLVSLLINYIAQRIVQRYRISIG
jgi:phosphate transport system permease protein